MSCPLCRTRKARRRCPALGQSICPLCCGTKRRVEIACPETCGWLQAAAAHPPAAEQRRRALDAEAATPMFVAAESRDRQVVLWAVLEATVRHAHAAIPRVIDRDVAEAVDALATTLETSARGLIYDRQPTSLPAQRLLGAYREALANAGEGSRPARFDREAAVALRSLGEALTNFAGREGATETAFLEWLQRSPIGQAPAAGGSRIEPAPGPRPGPGPDDEPRIIL